jgi:hypothetical protein
MVVDLLGAINERDYQDRIVELGRTFGWRAAHFGTANTGKGFRTPVRYDGKGFPDLVLVHDVWQRVILREVKAKRGVVSPEQAAWGVLLTLAGADYAVWYPTDWDDVVATLTNGRGATV